MFGVFEGNIIHAYNTMKHSKAVILTCYPHAHGSLLELRGGPSSRLTAQEGAVIKTCSLHLTALALTPDHKQLTPICLHWWSWNLPWLYPLLTMSPTMLITHPEPVFLHSVSSQQLKTPRYGTNKTWNFPQSTGSQSLISVSLTHATNQLEKSLNLNF